MSGSKAINQSAGKMTYLNLNLHPGPGPSVFFCFTTFAMINKRHNSDNMKYLKLSFCSALLLILISPGWSQAQTNTSPTDFMDKMFRKKTEEWCEAYNSGEAKNLLPFYNKDVIYIAPDVPEQAINGCDNLVSYFQNTIDLGGKMISLEIITLDISDDLATVSCKYRMLKGGVTVSGRNVMVLRRSGIKWQIFLHIVVSV